MQTFEMTFHQSRTLVVWFLNVASKLRHQIKSLHILGRASNTFEHTCIEAVNKTISIDELQYTAESLCRRNLRLKLKT